MLYGIHFPQIKNYNKILIKKNYWGGGQNLGGVENKKIFFIMGYELCLSLSRINLMIFPFEITV